MVCRMNCIPGDFFFFRKSEVFMDLANIRCLETCCWECKYMHMHHAANDTKLGVQTKATCLRDKKRGEKLFLRNESALRTVWRRMTKAQVHTIYGSKKRRCFVRFWQKAWNGRTKSCDIQSTRFLFYEWARITLNLHWIISLHTTIVISALSVSQPEAKRRKKQTMGHIKNTRQRVTQKAITIWKANELVGRLVYTEIACAYQHQNHIVRSTSQRSDKREALKIFPFSSLLLCCFCCSRFACQCSKKKAMSSWILMGRGKKLWRDATRANAKKVVEPLHIIIINIWN